MFRYLALIWNKQDSSQCEAAALLDRRVMDRIVLMQNCFQQDGIKIYCSHAAEDPFGLYPTNNQTGIVLGALFRRNRDINESSASADVAFDDNEDERISKSNGRSLISDYWGDYVAFLR